MRYIHFRRDAATKWTQGAWDFHIGGDKFSGWAGIHSYPYDPGYEYSRVYHVHVGKIVFSLGRLDYD